MMMKEKIKMIKQAADYILEKTGVQPEGGLILGTGLSSLTDKVEGGIVIPYKEIPGFPVSTAPSHRGQLMLGDFGNKKMLIMQGRFHYYEGYTMEQVTFPVRVMKELGVQFLIVTNAAGSLKENLRPGNIVLLEDHINFMGINPLIGQHDDYFGDRFPSLNEPYSQRLREIASQVAEKLKIDLARGVYLAVSGPSLESKSECRTFAQWGADLVGMSTVPEVIVGVQSRLELLGFSIVTNMSNLFHGESHQQKDIEKTARSSYEELSELLHKTIEEVRINIV
jgi:purine-nucleoside phosphorylase